MMRQLLSNKPLYFSNKKERSPSTATRRSAVENISYVLRKSVLHFVHRNFITKEIMPTAINILTRTPLSISLMNAMAAKIKEDECILEHFKLQASDYGIKAEVKILVNDVEVDLVSELVSFIAHVDKQMEGAILKKAKELIMKDNVLQDLASAIENAEYEIEQRLANVMKGYND